MLVGVHPKVWLPRVTGKITAQPVMALLRTKGAQCAIGT